MTQMLVPALVAAAWLLCNRIGVKRGVSPRVYQNTLIALLAGYTIIKCGFNFAMVSLWDQGHWYYPLCIMTFNLIVVVCCGRLLDERAVRSAEEADETPLRALKARFPGIAGFPVASIVVTAWPPELDRVTALPSKSIDSK